MSVKFLKNSPELRFARFVVPELNASVAPPSHNGIASAFSFPAVDSLPDVPEMSFEENSDDNISNLSEAEILQAAEAQAAQNIAEAQMRAVEIETEARESGLQSARETFAEEVAVQVREQMSVLQENLAQTIAEISALYGEIARQAERDLVELALEIAKKVIRRETAIDREIALTLARITLEKLSSRAVASIFLHPEDWEYMEKHRDRLNFHGAIKLVEDRSIHLGGCLIQTDAGDFDARIESQLEEISRGLLN